MVALVDAMLAGKVPAEPAVVLSNVGGAAGLELAQNRGVPTAVVEHRKITPRDQHERKVVETLREHGVEWVCLAGYMRLLTPVMVEAFPDRIVNIHPSLLPAFPGLHAQRQALEYGVRISGCTVHLVDEQCDHGPILMQATVPILDDDTEASLSARILEAEHRLYPEAVARYCRNGLRVEGRRAFLAPASPD